MEKYLGESIPKLGFGFMRLPIAEKGAVDLELTAKMVDLALLRGFTYFDTAYPYMNQEAEKAIGTTLVSRYPRESFFLATKLPVFFLKEKEDVPKYFHTSLERTGAGYFDFYLLHALDEKSARKAETLGAWDYIREMKAKGLIKHIGFSFHDTAEVLDDILTRHPEAEFVQLQINYVDWDNDNVQSRQCYETARRHGKPVIIMEPVKGGGLAAKTGKAADLIMRECPGKSPAVMALRYAASLEGIITVLSGMSNLEQVDENTREMNPFTPLSDGERETLDKAVEIFNSIDTVPCTRCNYCAPNCPQSINIPWIIDMHNQAVTFSDMEVYKKRYRQMTKEERRAGACLQCRVCEGFCPQHIKIPDVLEMVSVDFD